MRCCDDLLDGLVAAAVAVAPAADVVVARCKARADVRREHKHQEMLGLEHAEDPVGAGGSPLKFAFDQGVVRSLRFRLKEKGQG